MNKIEKYEMLIIGLGLLISSHYKGKIDG